MPPTVQQMDSAPGSPEAEPLPWFVAHHRRHRQMCRVIEGLAAEPDFNPNGIRQVLDYLDNELPVHLQDEEEDLFPLVRLRCEEGDDVGGVLQQLMTEHRGDEALGDALRGGLEHCLAAGLAPSLSPETSAALTDYAQRERRHLAIEDAVVLPIARLRLSAGDLEDLGRRLAHRRENRAAP